MKIKSNSLTKDKIEFIKNFTYAFGAVILQIGIVQLLILPLISKTMTSEQYGLTLTLISIVDIVAITFGAAICNVRLISLSIYENMSLSGDYNKYCIIYGSISVIISIIATIAYEQKYSISTILIGIMALMAFFFSYSQVSIRLNRKFQYDIAASLLIGVGYCIGFLIYRLTGLWQFIYIFGYGFGAIFCGIIIGKFYKEPIRSTFLFRKTNKQILELSTSSFIKQLITYADRLILYPILGGELVAIYYAATLVGKVISLFINPLNSLLLSYISPPKSGVRQYLIKILLISSGICFGMYWLCLLMSKPILLILYPQYCDAAMSIIHITLLSSMIEVVICIITPFTLKVFNTSLQVTISIISTVIYFIAMFACLKAYKLIGFSIAVLLSSIAKITIIIFVSLVYGKVDIERAK